MAARVVPRTQSRYHVPREGVPPTRVRLPHAGAPLVFEQMQAAKEMLRRPDIALTSARELRKRWRGPPKKRLHEIFGRATLIELGSQTKARATVRSNCRGRSTRLAAVILL